MRALNGIPEMPDTETGAQIGKAVLVDIATERTRLRSNFVFWAGLLRLSLLEQGIVERLMLGAVFFLGLTSSSLRPAMKRSAASPSGRGSSSSTCVPLMVTCATW